MSIVKFLRLLRSCILWVGCGAGVPLLAQELAAPESPVVWDLQTCLAYAKENNIQINTLRLNRKSTEQQYLLSRAALYPDLYGNASQAVNYGRNTGVNLSGTYGINSSWTLYNGGFLRLDIKQRDLAVQSANLSILEEENNVALQITSAYLNILLDKESIIYSQDLVNTSEQLLEQARQRYAAGGIARRDLVQFEAQLANDRYTLIASQNAQRQDMLVLKQLLQLPTEVPFDVAKPDTLGYEAAIPSLLEVQQHALENWPEVKNSEVGIAIAELDLEKARAGYRPIVSVAGSIASSYTNNPTFGASVGQFNDNFYQQVRFLMSVPLFTRRLNKTNVELAKISIDQARLLLKSSELLLSQRVEQAYINALNAQSQYQAANEQLQYIREVYRISNEELRIGTVNMFEFYQQRNLYVQNLQLYLQAKYSAALSVGIYDFYLGVPLKL
ncbi:TolC family protein [Rhabdobacter roseus]|uniref:Outer membrane protein n=1 Tax=Rhabdobacter roseus TaxID=1655419 RepID=A0A840TEH3_9BACT|nr:TolC family protein [Rhabdobacter roseus]MBB5282526.1 outer membrane protein [Rhabdobacter roseus]